MGIEWGEDDWIESTMDAIAFVCFFVFSLAATVLISVAIIRSVW